MIQMCEECAKAHSFLQNLAKDTDFMKNYKIIVSYDGARYKGWQRLGKGELTIQDTLERVISEVVQTKVELHGSGRTDAGVHARGQAANMKIPFALKKDFISKVNQGLPKDIRLLSVGEVSGAFHARYSANGKLYQYYVDTREKPNVFFRKYSCHFPSPLDMAEMRKAAKLLEGKHDFSSFTDDKTAEKDKVRTIYEIRMEEKDGLITFSYCGDGFLQHMVRILTGTLLEVGQGKKRSEDIRAILKKKERAAAGFMVPAKGLFLENVYYEDEKY